MTCYSSLFEGDKRDRGAVIARSNTSTRSLCWLRTKTMRQFDDTLAPMSEFFKVLHKQWADVCIEAAQFYISGKLQPAGTFNCPSNAETSITQFDSLVDPPVGTDTPVDQISLPPAPTTDAAESFTAIRPSISRIFVNHEKASRRLGDSQSEILFKIDHFKKTFVDDLTQQDLAFRSLIKSVHQEAQNQSDITSIELKAV
ncbi:hypothetical protein F511_42941 [Dorcoceras hygrometricum]|uniref:Uncharacterized protein n=1 Tax=Dorcoceras hygrometricum TaxID=472368 RepID=A0A2Z7A6F9_9LAMI|nr:hypothetical protein F511_42941 [Dorcoceras hygrometricum]